jgi:uncharacterized membrane protein YsdA (DUF1294 family)
MPGFSSTHHSLSFAAWAIFRSSPIEPKPILPVERQPVQKPLVFETTKMTIALKIYGGVVAILSIATFVVYGIDKQRAMNGSWRIPERTLQILSFLGGWPGALLAQHQLRHKTKKQPFLTIFWLLVALHLVLVGSAFKLASSFDAASGGRPQPILSP